MTNSKTEIKDAFTLSERFHHQDGKRMMLESTSFCQKTWQAHLKELEEAGFVIEQHFNTVNSIYGECMTVYLRKR